MASDTALRKALEEQIASEVAAIHRRAAEQGETLVREAERRVREREAQARRALDEESDLRTRRTLARTELKQRNALLRCKQSEIDRVFELALGRLDRLRETDTDSYCRLMSGIFDKCRRLLPSGSQKVLLGPGLDKVAGRLAREEGLVVESDSRLFGLRCEAEEGRVHCDGTIPKLLERLRREREAELESLLFGERS